MPWVIKLDFDRRIATVDQASTPALLHDIDVQDGEVFFSLSSDSELTTFGGRILVGQVLRGGIEVPASLRLLSKLPKPSSREEAWEHAAQDRFLPYDRSFDLPARSEFVRAIEDIRKSLSKVTDPQVIVGLSRAVALSHNAHTRLYLLRMLTLVGFVRGRKQRLICTKASFPEASAGSLHEVIRLCDGPARRLDSQPALPHPPPPGVSSRMRSPFFTNRLDFPGISTLLSPDM